MYRRLRSVHWLDVAVVVVLVLLFVSLVVPTSLLACTAPVLLLSLPPELFHAFPLLSHAFQCLSRVMSSPIPSASAEHPFPLTISYFALRIASTLLAVAAILPFLLLPPCNPCFHKGRKTSRIPCS